VHPESVASVAETSSGSIAPAADRLETQC